MMQDSHTFLKYVIEPTLLSLGENNPVYGKLLLGTALQEYRYQPVSKHSRGIGIYNIAPQTHRFVWDKYLAFNPDCASKVRGMASQRNFLADPHQELITNLSYSTAIAYVIYQKSGRTLPEKASFLEIAQFWHKHFHSRPSGSIQEFYSNLLSQLPLESGADEDKSSIKGFNSLSAFEAA